MVAAAKAANERTGDQSFGSRKLSHANVQLHTACVQSVQCCTNVLAQSAIPRMPLRLANNVTAAPNIPTQVNAA